MFILEEFRIFITFTSETSEILSFHKYQMKQKLKATEMCYEGTLQHAP